ncbi:diacylglycerol kinase family protein [Gordonia sp. CPCC 205515]|uniref:diacylglycerol/lipid kinase family protein n=1 Tax=Gordonia sp. CPCC 205515 TaxID=3140791 RepID=UPI003AF3D98A
MTASEQPPPSTRRRLSAIVALIAIVVLAVLVIDILIGNFIYVVIGIAGLALAFAGAWWLATEQSLRRIAGIGSIVAGFAIMVVMAVLAAADDASATLHIVALAVVLAIATGCARYALVSDLHALDRKRESVRPTRPVLICNPKSGGGKVEKFGLVSAASELGVETIVLGPDDDLEQLARDAVAHGADCLGMAGGDGSQALVASVAIEHDIPFVCISAGTRNHFALDLGLDRDDPRQGLRAFRDAVARHVDYATVNGRLFVNNVSLGIYATIVQEESYRAEKAQTVATMLPKLLGRDAKPFDLQFTTPTGQDVDGAYLILVSNNPYAASAGLDAATRRRLDTGQLGVIAVSTSTAAETVDLLTRSAIGLRKTSPFWHEFTTDSFEIRSRTGTVFTGIDGEALEMPTPLRFDSHPKGLHLLVPSGNRAVAERRKARDVRLGAIVDIARGRTPRM